MPKQKKDFLLRKAKYLQQFYFTNKTSIIRGTSFLFIAILVQYNSNAQAALFKEKKCFIFTPNQNIPTAVGNAYSQNNLKQNKNNLVFEIAGAPRSMVVPLSRQRPGYSPKFKSDHFVKLFPTEKKDESLLNMRVIRPIDANKPKAIVQMGYDASKGGFLHIQANGVEVVSGNQHVIDAIPYVNYRENIKFYNNIESFFENLKKEIRQRQAIVDSLVDPNVKKQAAFELDDFKNDNLRALRDLFKTLRPSLDYNNNFHGFISKHLRSVPVPRGADFQYHHDIRVSMILKLSNQYPQYSEQLLCLLNSPQNHIKVTRLAHMIVHEAAGEITALSADYFKDTPSKPEKYEPILRTSRERGDFLPIEYLNGTKEVREGIEEKWRLKRTNKVVYLFYGEVDGVPTCELYETDNNLSFEELIKNKEFLSMLNQQAPGSLQAYPHIRQFPNVGNPTDINFMRGWFEIAAFDSNGVCERGCCNQKGYGAKSKQDSTVEATPRHSGTPIRRKGGRSPAIPKEEAPGVGLVIEDPHGVGIPAEKGVSTKN